ncbi:multidrug resistance-associated protein 5-like [Pollicipes pollicipes]|uniref:multidrug resistance-associated protein 5-like n=1 Tax=Pollicipes pollicipes TaxID=41117 RepID=UPI0018856A30|nr:multidrug resistance-associated protein 5-like [Pollicipes pollicipes]
MPVRPASKEPEHVMPGPSRGCLSLFSLHWMTGLMWKAYNGTITTNDVWRLRPDDASHHNCERLERHWEAELAQRGATDASLSRALLRTFRMRTIVSSVAMVVALVLQIIGPSILLAAMMNYVNDPSAPYIQGVYIMLLILACRVGYTYCFYGRPERLVRSIYRKMLRLRVTSDQVLGKMVNICINDMERLFDAFTTGPLVFCTSLRMKLVVDTDRRVTLTSEIIAATHLIKMYAWEDSFRDRVMEMRADEHEILQKAAFLQSFSNTTCPLVAVLATIATILGYVLSGNVLTAQAAFATFAVFNAMQFPIGALPYGVKIDDRERKVQHVALKQSMKATVVQPDTKATLETAVPANGAHPLAANGAHPLAANGATIPAPPNGDQTKEVAVVETEVMVTLRDISLRIDYGRLVGVAGSVGSGKTSLLAAIMGQVSGKITSVDTGLRSLGSCALRKARCAVGAARRVVSQVAWIFCGTMRENILFGAPLVLDLYNRVLDVCALRTDLEMMEHGDLSEIGDRGLNLSGGQKQRINMARAVYAAADIYLLDDPLSAVDSNVGKHIFNHCVRGHLSGKTVLLVSHGAQYLSQCDEVLMMKEGRLVERGTHAELMERRGEYFKLVSYDTTTSAHQTPNKHLTPGNGHPKPGGTAEEEGEKIEKRLTGEESFVPKLGFFSLLYLYVKPAGLAVMMVVVLLIILFSLSRTAIGVYLQYWLDTGDGLMEERLRNQTGYNVTYTAEQLAGVINDNPDLNQHMIIYSMMAVLMWMNIVTPPRERL